MSARLLRRCAAARAVDGVIDLHGMRQDEAHFALLNFLHRSQAAGYGVVLVITGKGGAAGGYGLFEERGVLRRVVPHWLRLPELRSLVLGFESLSPPRWIRCALCPAPPQAGRGMIG